MIEIKLKNPEDFLKVKETLTRMGIANNKDKTSHKRKFIDKRTK